MDIVKLTTFLSLAKTENLSKTADEMYCSQAAISKQISALENYYGVRLFDRVGRNIKINRNGIILLKYSEKIIKLNHDCIKELSKTNTAGSSKVRVGATSFIANYVLPVLVSTFHGNSYGTNIDLFIDYFTVVLEKVRHFKLDFGFISQHKIHWEFEGLKLLPFETDELVLILSKDNFLAEKDTITIEDLESQTFLISSKPYSATREFFEDALKKAGAPTPICQKFGNTESIKQGVAKNYGVAVLSCKSAVNIEAQLPVKTAHIKGLTLKRYLYCVKQRDEALSQSSIDFLAEFIDNPENYDLWQSCYKAVN
ncbi:MAG: LysR family transcriptional regulator [Veillonellales bacterium]